MGKLERRAEFTQLTVLGALVVLTGLVFVSTLAESVQLPKAVVAAVASVIAATLVLIHTGRSIDFSIPRQASVVVGSFMLASVVAVIAGGSPLREIVGAYGRWTGAALYVSLGVLMLLVAGLGAGSFRLLRFLAVTTGLVALYANLQRLGLDPIPWINPYGEKVGSTIGNPNFAASYTGFGVPVWLWMFMSTRRPFARVACIAVILVHLLALIWTGSLQGPIVTAVGAGVFAYVVATRFGGLRRPIRQVLVGGAGLGGLLGIGGVAGVGPLATMDWSTIRIRIEYWRAAFEMVGDSPIWGWGFTGYASRFREYRSLEAFEHGSLTFGNDAAHNVLLDMLVSGGLILGLSYLGVVAIVTMSLVRSVRLAEVGDLPVIGAIAGVWIGYLGQSMISIDVPPLAVIGWVAGGLVLSRESPRDIAVLRWPCRVSKSRTIVAWGAVLTVFAALTLGSVALVRQASADRQYAVATQIISAGPAAALQAAQAAAASAPWEPRYLREVGDVLYASGRGSEALEWYERAARVDPYWLPAAVVSARLSVELGDLERASRWYERAIGIEPLAPELRLEAAEVAIAREQPSMAIAHLEAALEVDPGQEVWWRLLADARRAVGDIDGANEAEQRADELS